MASYTIKELNAKSTEELIGVLILQADSMTKASRQTEEKVFKLLAERNVIDYDSMKKEYETIGMW